MNEEEERGLGGRRIGGDRWEGRGGIEEKRMGRREEYWKEERGEEEKDRK